MTCSEKNFIQSQWAYAFSIAKNSELPPLSASDADWEKAIDRLVQLSGVAASRQISYNKSKEEKAQ